ncbi:MAG: hypothetical protein Q4Q23_00035 [Methanobacteriaceae archaeon]|nr:hypothetical protein [Methanobacteriaceae archaeon]
MLITTSRKPSQKTRRFSQILRHIFNIEYINRGKTSMNKLMIHAKNMDVTKIIIVSELRGNPSHIDIFDISDNDPILSLNISVNLPDTKNRVKIKRDDLSFKNSISDLDCLSEIFDIKKEDETKNLTNCMCIDSVNDKITISFIEQDGTLMDFKIYVSGYKVNISNTIQLL